MLQLRLEPRQTQRIVITPQLRQAIKLLQLSSLELQSYVENEIRENPLLTDQQSPGPDGSTEEGDYPLAGDGGDADVPTFDVRDCAGISSERGAAAAEPEMHGEIDGDAVVSDAEGIRAAEWSSVPAGASGAREGAGGDYDPFATLASPLTLAAHLREQAGITFARPVDLMIAAYLIDLVDADGYIRTPLDNIAQLLSVSLIEVEQTLGVLQSFDPPGVCARDLAECLTLQLKEKGRYDPFMERLLAHLHLVAACDFQRLKKVCGVDHDDLREMIGELRMLNPRPGAAFQTVAVETLVPDVIVKRERDGMWKAKLNPAAAPCLAVDRAYYAALKPRCRSDKDRAYLSEKLSSANWLVKSLEQRLTTILKVATAVIEEQSAFFDHGVRHLKPLNLRQIALKIGMHESTVSRVTSNKAIATPRGIFEMKYFFTSAIASAGPSREVHSSEAVRDRIKEFISNENAAEVLSDDRIVTLLRAEGIDIARRTVAKYREALRIPSSAARRRQKRAAYAA